MMLLQTPLFWAFLTIAAFIAGQQLYLKLHKPIFLPPILTAILLLVGALAITATPYVTYMQGGRFLHELLGPLIVMLAVPLYQQFHTLRRQWLRISLAISAGSLTTIAAAWWLTDWLLNDDVLATTMLAKSITTPVAVAVTQQLGGNTALAASFVIVTGILGAVMIAPMLKLMKLDQPETVGLTLGTCGHAIGTARALELGPVQSAYAATAMTLTATLHAILLPWLF
ncbi:LrgB family protein [Oceanobacter mangrovi]|uniref:LrgB family protein n=1 Tax=Oceanobacter mangrovi TaxID=2862510 RepID=UPI001C8DC8D1|nr:LrgB family protein [Oceanobacter mangrovi]